MQEAVIAERFMGCRGVAQLLDSFLGTGSKKSWCLVYDRHGDSLSKVLELGPLPPLGVKAIFADVLTGLACVHKAGFVHADVKPPNIFVRTGGHGPSDAGWSAVVGDLGSAVEVAVLKLDPGATLFLLSNGKHGFACLVVPGVLFARPGAGQWDEGARAAAAIFGGQL